jgi:hypothetical protein
VPTQRLVPPGLSVMMTNMLSCKLDDHLEWEGSRMFQNLFF